MQTFPPPGDTRETWTHNLKVEAGEVKDCGDVMFRFWSYTLLGHMTMHRKSPSEPQNTIQFLPVSTGDFDVLVLSHAVVTWPSGTGRQRDGPGVRFMTFIQTCLCPLPSFSKQRCCRSVCPPHISQTKLVNLKRIRHSNLPDWLRQLSIIRLFFQYCRGWFDRCRHICRTVWLKQNR